MKTYELKISELRYLLNYYDQEPNHLSPIFEDGDVVDEESEAIKNIMKAPESQKLLAMLIVPIKHVIIRSQTLLGVKTKVSFLQGKELDESLILIVEGNHVLLLFFQDKLLSYQWLSETYSKDFEGKPVESGFKNIHSIEEYLGGLFALDLCIFDYYEGMLLCKPREAIALAIEDVKARYAYELANPDTRWNLPRALDLFPSLNAPEELSDDLIQLLIEKDWLQKQEEEGQIYLASTRKAYTLAAEIMFANPVFVGVQALVYDDEGIVDVSSRFMLITSDVNNHFLELGKNIFGKAMNRVGFKEYLTSWFEKI